MGRVVRGPNNNPPKPLMTAWCNNKRPPGKPLMSNKKSFVKSLQILLPDEMSGDKKGLLNNWIHIAMNKKCWDHKIEKLKKPGVNIPEPSSTDQNRGNYNHNTPKSPPPPSPPRHRRRRNTTTSPLRSAFEVLGLEPNASEREVRVRFRQLSRKYHPDKHQQSETGMSDDEATNYFHKVNNAQELLISHLRSVQQ